MMPVMPPPGRRLRQLAWLVHVALAGAGVVWFGAVRDFGAGASREIAVLAVGVLALLHVLDAKWPSERRHTSAWAALAVVIAAAVAAQIGSAGDLGRLTVTIAGAWCLACVLGAAACVSMLGPSGFGSLRVSGRVLGVLFVSGFGLVPTIAVRQAEAAGPASIAVLALGALAVGTARLDAALRGKDLARASRIAGELSSGTWLALTALAAAALAAAAAKLHADGAKLASLGWPAARSIARLAWLYTFPLVGAFYVVFAGRIALVGLGVRSRSAAWFPAAAVTLAAVAGARFGLFRSTPSVARPVVPAAEPKAAPTPAHGTVVPEPPAVPRGEPSTSASAPSASASGGPAPVPSSSLPPAASVPSPGPGRVSIQSLSTRGMLETDARAGLTRRFALLEACLEGRVSAIPETLSVRIFVDRTGSVSNVRPEGGELVDTPFGQCAIRNFYRMGFASGGDPASFELTLLVTPAQ